MTIGSSLRRLALVVAAAAPLILLPAVAQPAMAAVPGQITITNPDVIPGNSSVIFSRIEKPADTYQRVHDKVKLRLTNTGDTAVVVNSVAATPTYKFTATPAWTLPTTLYKGQSIDVTVAFIVTYGRWHSGDLVVTSTPAGGTATSTNVKLTGYWQRYSEQGLEPTLAEIVSNFGYGTAMPASSYSRGAYQTFSADEVLSPYWKLLDPAAPVGLTQLASYRGYPTTNLVKTYQQGSPAAATTVLTGLKQDAQSLLPRNSAWAPGRTTFAASGTFGFQLDDAFSDPALNSEAAGRAQGCKAAVCSQLVRVWKARTSTGDLIPGTYIMVMDFNGGNFDYNDSMFVVSNIQPAV